MLTLMAPFNVKNNPEEAEHHKKKMTNCPKCNKPCYYAERIACHGRDWHQFCYKCQNCGRSPYVPGATALHAGKLYCKRCYNVLFGPNLLYKGN